MRRRTLLPQDDRKGGRGKRFANARPPPPGSPSHIAKKRKLMSYTKPKERKNMLDQGYFPPPAAHTRKRRGCRILTSSERPGRCAWQSGLFPLHRPHDKSKTKRCSHFPPRPPARLFPSCVFSLTSFLLFCFALHLRAAASRSLRVSPSRPLLASPKNLTLHRKKRKRESSLLSP